MTSLNAKFALIASCAALVFAIAATPASAQRQHRHTGYAPTQTQTMPVEHYPNGAEKTGSAANLQSGAEFNTGY
jgi:hypothetical protein